MRRRSTVELIAFLIFVRPLGENGGRVHPAWNVEKTRSRAEGRVVPVCPSLVIRENHCAFRRWTNDVLGDPLVIQSRRPSHFDERLSKKEFTGHPVKYVEKPIAIGKH